MKFNLIISLTLMVLLSSWSTISQAQDKKVGGHPDILPIMDFDQSFRHTTNDIKTSSSTCIGNPVTPVCAVETYKAALLQGQNYEHLMAIAKGKKPGSSEALPKSPHPIVIGHRIISIRQFSPDSVPPPSRSMFSIEAWDVAITTENRYCTYNPCADAIMTSTSSYLVRKGKYGWFVLFSVSNIRDLTSYRDIEYNK